MDESAVKAWYAMRIQALHERATVHDILRRNGVSFRHTGDREEQVSCPFHGKDESPSARVYPASPRSPSHVWCFVCRERWDIISLWKKYHGEDKTFHQTLSSLEKLYGIVTPPVPEGTYDKGVPASQQSAAEFEQFYGVCEQRLTGARDDYVRLQDMHGYLSAGSVLDKVYYRVGEGTMSHQQGLEILKKLIIRIGERVRGSVH